MLQGINHSKFYIDEDISKKFRRIYFWSFYLSLDERDIVGIFSKYRLPSKKGYVKMKRV